MRYIAISLLLAHLSASTPYVEATSNPSKSRHGTLSFSYQPNITRVTIDHPPINLFDSAMASDFLDFFISIQPSSARSSSRPPPPKVVIIDSADPDFFIPHVDLHALLLPTTPSSQLLLSRLASLSQFLRNTTTSIFITSINGRASGYGNEFLLQTDMRFAGPGARVSQLETAIGGFPGGGGAQALPRLINRGGGLRYILPSEGVGGAEGERLGWFDGYCGDEAGLRREVERVAGRMALFPAEGLRAAKEVVVRGLFPSQGVYDGDVPLFRKVTFGEESQRLIRKALVLGRNQTRSRWELGIPDTLIELYA